MQFLNFFVTNAFIFLIPVFLWNMLLTRYLPPPYGTKEFDQGIPRFILLGEQLFRIPVFLLPLLIKTNPSTSIGKIGLIIYIVGVIIYFFSWLVLIKWPNSNWSQSKWGFTAPAYTPFVWLFGLALMADSYFFDFFSYEYWHYLIFCILFVGFHLIHSKLSFRKKSF